jgi:AcrR family transcriptional regulator
LVASAGLFEQRGYHNVSMDDIAAAVGITGPGLYRHFPNKHDVLVQALDAQISAMELLTARVLATNATGEARFDAFLAALAQLVVDSHQVLLSKRERAHLEHDAQEAVPLRIRGVTDRAQRLVQGWRPELADADARLLSWVLQSVHTHQRRVPPEPGRPRCPAGAHEPRRHVHRPGRCSACRGAHPPAGHPG